MAEEWIRYKSGVHDTSVLRVKVNERKITASVKPIGVVLSFPLEWEANTEDWRDKGYTWEIIDGSGSLVWGGSGGERIASSLPVYPTNRRPHQVEFVLNPTQVEELEVLRDSGNVKFLLTLVFHMVLFTSVNLPRTSGAPNIHQITINECPLSVNLPIEIPKSVYEENVLPGLGIRGLTSLTITIPPGVRGLLAAALYELDKAQKTLQTAATEEQFESVVMQCRNALDALLNQFHLDLPAKEDGKPDASFATRVDAFTEQFLKEALSDSQAGSVNKNLKALWQPYSAATKPGPPHHSKAYASFALHQVASVVKLVSEVLWAKQKTG
jgi:hypothetical protein